MKPTIVFTGGHHNSALVVALYLKTGKFYQQLNPFTHLKTIFGFLQALFLLLMIRPKFIVSFGGYLSVPIVIAGWFLHIDSVSHEQTVVAGWANRAIAP